MNFTEIFLRISVLKKLSLYCSTAFYLLLILLPACSKGSASPNTVPLFDSVPTKKPVTPIINEISGIADSKINPGYLWGLEDSGNPPQIYLIGHSGTVLKTIYIKDVFNRDWEDMAIMDNNIYIGEIGDNNQSYTEYSIYKFPEPASSVDTIKNVETIRFTYPDGSHDAEAFLVDANTKDIYIITKRDNPSRIYKLAFPYATASVNKLVRINELPYSGVVSAALSPDNKAILIKTYTNLYYYKKSAGESIEQVLQKTFTSLPYTLEPQGEAVSFAADNSGFYTLSEKGFFTSVSLYFYKRK